MKSAKSGYMKNMKMENERPFIYFFYLEAKYEGGKLSTFMQGLYKQEKKIW